MTKHNLCNQSDHISWQILLKATGQTVLYANSWQNVFFLKKTFQDYREARCTPTYFPLFFLPLESFHSILRYYILILLIMISFLHTDFFYIEFHTKAVKGGSEAPASNNLFQQKIDLGSGFEKNALYVQGFPNLFTKASYITLPHLFASAEGVHSVYHFNSELLLHGPGIATQKSTPLPSPTNWK